MSPTDLKCDVAIIGGGPAGSTVGALLKKYSPDLDVVLIERETFPRDHVGESHLPAISRILDEMGVWDKVEAANFSIKLGGTYRWGQTDELWDFEFLPGERFTSEDRPAKFSGQRRETAFQVDRSVYDHILLEHARSLGVRVFEATKVSEVRVASDRVLSLSIGEPSIEARYYVDASGDSGILRRNLGVEVDSPTALRNIAIWDYYVDADWAVEIGRGGTRIQVMSLGWAWVWFISISPTHTSVGVVLPASYFRESGKTTEEIFLLAVQEEPRIRQLIQNATREGKLQATKDWSFIADRLCGENWFLSGDSCGFADPILSAGMTLAHTSARKVAYSILELERGQLDPKWIRDEYDQGHRQHIRHHIQFADYWYSANGRFTDLKEYCTEIAASAGLKLDADHAFRWLAAGGFALEEPGAARAGTFRVGGVKFLTQLFTGTPGVWQVAVTNRFQLNLVGSAKSEFAYYLDGKIEPVTCYRRGNSTLQLLYVYRVIASALQVESDGLRLQDRCVHCILVNKLAPDPDRARALFLDTLEAMIAENWVTAKVNKSRPFLQIHTPEETSAMHRNRD